MPDPTLLMLFDEVRGKTLEVLEGVTPQQSVWRPPGLQNNILWHAAHCFVVVESLAMRALDKPPRMPEGWFEIFSWKARPDDFPADRWPPLNRVVDELQAQPGWLRPILAELSEAQLAAAVPRTPDRTVRHLIVHAVHDEACHAGEIWLLRKVQDFTGTTSGSTPGKTR